MKILTLFLFLLIAAAAAKGQTTYNAATCNESDVQTAITNELADAVDGDIVNIPSGSCSWASELDASFTHSVTVKGQGAKSATTGGASTTGSDVTTINIGSGGQLNIIAPAGKSVRVTGIAFLTSAGSPIMLFISGASTAVRVDHCHFFTTFESMELDGSVQGVADHNFFDGPLNSVVFSIAFHNGQNWNGASGDPMGNASWTDTEHWGSSQFFFAEDNNFNVDIGDGHNGARYVIRHNTMQNSYTNQHGDQMYNHGVTPDPARGVRAVEMYLNNATGPTGTGNPFLSINSGAALFWSNSMTQYRGGAAVDYYNRKHQAGGNYTYSAPPNGWGYCGSANGGPTNWDQNTNSQGYACIDQPGRGAGDLLSGTVFPGIVNQTQGNVIAQPHQALVPIYSWNNTLTSAYSDNILAIQNTGLFTNNVDYYQQFGTFGNAGSFNGTAGVGQGLLSARTGTCTTGVGYWATDTTTLYVCGPTNTWTTYYTPYTYPHPLAGGTPTAATPSCTPTSGNPPQTVTCTDATSGAIMCYTTNGTTPATNGTSCTTGTLYSTAITISVNSTLKVIAGHTGYFDSSVSTYTYGGTAPLAPTNLTATVQ